LIRITTKTEPQAITFTVDGRLAGEYVGALGTCVEQAVKHGRRVCLHLREVSTIDESGRALLSCLAAKGIKLSASGIYSSYIVARLCQPATRRKSRQETPPT